MILLTILFIIFKSPQKHNDESQEISFFKSLKTLNSNDIEEVQISTKGNADVIIITKKNTIGNILDIFNSIDFTNNNETKIDPKTIADDVLFYMYIKENGKYPSSTIYILPDSICYNFSLFKFNNTKIDKLFEIIHQNFFLLYNSPNSLFNDYFIYQSRYISYLSKTKM